jgi:hypothetical protein
VQQVGVKNFTYVIHLHGKNTTLSLKFGFIRGGQDWRISINVSYLGRVMATSENY